ncbi:sensor histidine kinase [Sphingomonas solaris]|uniref:histidine kinase n=2 Tax=Alterirhizorhabdus solaris TaxID=2529389 RepID=A0A558QZS5_9SPHN|nr:sensor histidine kinase [Sphingomonas solaris]
MSSLFGRLSTGMKMLLILSAALLPLGMIAIFASIESAKANRLTREAEVRLIAAESARRVTVAISTASSALRSGFAASGVVDTADCRRMLGAIAAAKPYRIDLGIFDSAGRRICVTGGFTPNVAMPPAAGIGTEVRVVESESLLRFSVGGLPGGEVAVGELPRETIVALLALPREDGAYGARLREGDAVITMSRSARDTGPLARKVLVAAPVAGGQMSLELGSPPTPIRAIEVLMILLPILMWLAAALIGWIVVDRLVLRPLGQLQRAITAYGDAKGTLRLPTLTTPSREIRALAEAFSAVTRTLTAHEAELENGLARQTKLTREVHHRVKNNLQVVSSLINLHARGVANPEVGAAYASIQRRVDALAVVHRNHYAELEENRGVGLRPLLGELASNLRATAPPEAASMAITLELLPAFASQDVAVPVAFMVTELVELAMICDPRGGVAIRLSAGDRPDRAELSVVAPGLIDETCRDHPSHGRSSRVLEGLSRQLRAPLDRDPAIGRYSIAITIVPADDVE